jgi:hypothetical protein
VRKTCDINRSFLSSVSLHYKVYSRLCNYRVGVDPQGGAQSPRPAAAATLAACAYAVFPAATRDDEEVMHITSEVMHVISEAGRTGIATAAQEGSPARDLTASRQRGVRS